MHPLSQFKFCPKCGSDKFIENNVKSKRCKNCGFVYYFNSCAATVAVIINENKELLVATRAHEPVKGTLDLPGGFVDLHETGEEAMSREVKEETGLDVDEIKYLFSVPNIYIYSGFEVHTLDLVYLCKIKDTHVLKAEDDVAKLEFIKVSELNPDLFGLLSIKEVIQKIQKMTI
ncbi:MAG: NUDIX domain-containing protein [Prevotella sp.]|jgi:mutator protein MutT|nr:NUDIX domain-containing protein [Prevotella sp.]